MQNVNPKKNTQKIAQQKLHRTNFRALARRAGIPEFMLRLAQERHVRIFSEQFIPKYRHD